MMEILDFERYLESLSEYKVLRAKKKQIQETIENYRSLMNGHPTARLVINKNDPSTCVGKTSDGIIVLFSNPPKIDFAGKKAILLSYQERQSRKNPDKKYIKCFDYLILEEIEKQIQNYTTLADLLDEKEKKIIEKEIWNLFLKYWEYPREKFEFLLEKKLLLSIPDSAFSRFPLIFVFPDGVEFSNPYSKPYYTFSISSFFGARYYKYPNFRLTVYLEEFMREEDVKVFSNTIIIAKVFLPGDFAPETEKILDTFIPGYLSHIGYCPSMGYYPDLQFIAIDDRVWKHYEGKKVLDISGYAKKVSRHFIEKYSDIMGKGYTEIKEEIGRYTVTLKMCESSVNIIAKDKKSGKECVIMYDLPRYAYCYFALFSVMDYLLNLLGDVYEE